MLSRYVGEGLTVAVAQDLVWIQRRSAAAREAIERRAAETPAQLFLPGMDDLMRAMPNHIARSSLFAPVARGRKRMHKDSVLVCRADAEIRFWGEQLDEAQADVWMHAMHEAAKRPLGEAVAINRAAFLRAIGRQTGKYEYDWLHRAMKALAFAMLVIKVKKGDETKLAIGKTRALHMIEGFDYDEDDEVYTLRIDPRWRGMYGNREFALIDWDKRMQIGRSQDLAKAMQRLLAASADQLQRFSLEWLKGKMEYSSPMRKFREALAAACAELERIEIISTWRMEDSTKGKPQLTLWLPKASG